MKATLADQFEVAAGLASGISRYAAGIGIDADPIAQACGLDPDRFHILGERGQPRQGVPLHGGPGDDLGR